MQISDRSIEGMALRSWRREALQPSAASAASSAALQQPPFGAPLVGGGGSGVLPKARTGGPAGSSAQPAKLPPKSRVA